MAEHAPTPAAPDPVLIAVCADPASDRELLKAAARLAVDLNLPFLEKPARTGWDALLTVTPDRLVLAILRGDAALKGGKPVSGDLSAIDIASSAGRSLDQPIAKAVGYKKRSEPSVVIDATAGWAEDSWLLAGLGCRVLGVERNKVVFTLARDSLLRAGAGNPDVLMRTHLIQADARHLLRRIARLNQNDGPSGPGGPGDDLPPSMQEFLRPDVVYLDPMFPSGRKTAERKPMKLLRKLVGDDGDAAELVEWALRVATKRVVVKRPPKAEPLASEPTMSFAGKGVRYDVYVIKARG
ncbi:MAG: class I SAM-dependent methyltransferase [Planctomycetota bacterium]|nr:class I SAM-dependent methyltransferase [Planctomycetota bacterium]